MNLSQALSHQISHSGLERIIPIAFGVVTWLLLALLGGVLLSADGLSLGVLLIFAGFGLLFLPIYRFRPWDPGLSSRVKRFIKQNTRPVLITGALLVLVRIPVVVDQLSIIMTIVVLPLRLVPMGLFDAKIYYAATVSNRFGQAVFTAGRIYVEVLWFYVIGNLLTDLLQRIPWP